MLLFKMSTLTSYMARAILTKHDIIAQTFSFLLGIAINTFPVYATILLSTVILIYLLVIFARSTMHPETLLTGVQEQVTDTRLWIDDEAAARRSVDMYTLSVRGYKSLMRCASRLWLIIITCADEYNFKDRGTRQDPFISVQKRLHRSTNLSLCCRPPDACDGCAQMSVGHHGTAI